MSEDYKTKDCWHTNHVCSVCKEFVFIVSRGESVLGLCMNQPCKMAFTPVDYRWGQLRSPAAIRTEAMATAFGEVMKGFSAYRSGKNFMRRQQKA